MLSSEEVQLSVGAEGKIEEYAVLFEEWPIFLKYPAFKAEDVYGTGSDKDKILVDKSQRPILTGQELAELRDWPTARTTVMARGISSCRLEMKILPSQSEEHAQHSRNSLSLHPLHLEVQMQNSETHPEEDDHKSDGDQNENQNEGQNEPIAVER